jgi:putative ABC transport system permease protein
MRTLHADLVYAVRSWRQARAAVTAAVLALALGIGASTAMFSVLSGVLLKPLPYPSGERLVMVWQDNSSRGRSGRDWVSPGLFAEWAARATTLEHFGAVRGWQPNLTAVDEPERLRGAAVSAGYFEALRVAPMLGRIFTADDDRPGSAPVVVISHGLWARRFSSNSAIVGHPVVLDGIPTEVVGVMPGSFVPAVVDADVWAPIRIDRSAAPRGVISLRVIAGLKAGVPLAQARAEMVRVATVLRSEDPEWERLGIAVVPLAEELVGAIRPTVRVLSGAVLMVLLIACANVASLLLARATERGREIAIRAVLGASRRRLVRQLLTESLAVAALGGAGGLLIAMWGVKLLVTLAPPVSPRLLDVTVDGSALSFAVVLTFAAAVLAGLAPALAATRLQLTLSLRDGIRGVTSSTRLRSWLVALEIAAALVLAVGAAMLLRSLVSLQRVDLGFDPSGVMTASISPPRVTYDSDEKLQALYASILEQAAREPGVRGAALVSVLPLSGTTIMVDFAVEGRAQPQSPGQAPLAGLRAVSADYFRVMGMRLIEGRGFSGADRAGAEPVAIVNQVTAARYWPSGSPLGRHLRVQGREATIVGVVANVRHAGPAVPADAELYVPVMQSSGPGRGAWIVAKAEPGSTTVATAIRSAVRRSDPNLPVAQVAPLDDLLARVLAPARFVATLIAGFSVLATALALIGIYSVMSFTVSRRTRDIGVRMALGASRPSVLALVLRQSLLIAAAGVAAGTVVALSLSAVLQTLLFEVQASDPWTIAATAALVLAAAMLATYAPARRAARIDPLAALRED